MLATFRANLQRVRAATAQFQADTGVWPQRLADLTAPMNSNPPGTPKGTYKGPYLRPTGGIGNTGVPPNPFADPNDAIDAHWAYTPKTGVVQSAVTGNTLENIPLEKL
jgi:hypothetical protein